MYLIIYCTARDDYSTFIDKERVVTSKGYGYKMVIHLHFLVTFYNSIDLVTRDFNPALSLDACVAFVSRSFQVS